MKRPVIKLAPGAALFRIFDIDIPQAQKGAPVFLGGLEIVGGQTPNAVDGNGGGIKSINADLTVNGCLVHSNHAFGDGGGVWATGDQCMLRVQGTTASVSANFADGYGGGIAVRNIYTLIEDGAKVNDNKAGKSGGGIAALADDFIPRGGPAAGNKLLEIGGGGQRGLRQPRFDVRVGDQLFDGGRGGHGDSCRRQTNGLRSVGWWISVGLDGEVRPAPISAATRLAGRGSGRRKCGC